MSADINGAIVFDPESFQNGLNPEEGVHQTNTRDIYYLHLLCLKKVSALKNLYFCSDISYELVDTSLMRSRYKNNVLQFTINKLLFVLTALFHMLDEVGSLLLHVLLQLSMK